MIRAPGASEQQNGLADLAADLTPLLDVLFILLVFFVLTANTAQVALDLTLPNKGSESAKALKDENKVVVAIFEADGKWAVDGTEHTDWDAAKSAMEQARADKPKARFVIAGDRKVSLERFLQTLSHLRALGLKQTDIIMEQR